MTKVLHQKVHSVSHFQVALMQPASPYPEDPTGSALAVFTGTGVAVSTAWDENGTAEPHVEIAVSGFDEPVPAGVDGLSAAAIGMIEVGGNGLDAGNWITGDVAHVAVPAGTYWVLVLLDTIVAFKARKVCFHLWPRGSVTP